MIRPFTDFLMEQRGGETAEELAKSLNQLVAQVERTGRKGSLVYTIEVAPVSKETSGQLIVRDDVKLKLPQVARGATVFFSTPENNLTRRDPRQAELTLKAVPDSTPALLKPATEGAA